MSIILTWPKNLRCCQDEQVVDTLNLWNLLWTSSFQPNIQKRGSLHTVRENTYGDKSDTGLNSTSCCSTTASELQIDPSFTSGPCAALQSDSGCDNTYCSALICFEKRKADGHGKRRFTSAPRICSGHRELLVCKKKWFKYESGSELTKLFQYIGPQTLKYKK